MKDRAPPKGNSALSQAKSGEGLKPGIDIGCRGHPNGNENKLGGDRVKGRTWCCLSSSQTVADADAPIDRKERRKKREGQKFSETRTSTSVGGSTSKPLLQVVE